MGFVVTVNNILHEDVTQASVYLDACFILAAINVDDHRHDLVMRVLDHMTDQGIRWVTNTHVSTEVVNNLFKIKILRALQLYHEYVTIPVHRRRPLTAEQNDELIDLQAIKAIYHQAKATGYLTSGRNNTVRVNPYDLMKFLKQLPRQRLLLSSFYKSARSTYLGFKELLEDYGFTIDYGFLDENIEGLALAYTYLYQVDMADAVHLASARWYQCDLFLTLDSDFEVGNYTDVGMDDNLGIPMVLTEEEEKTIRIFKVA